jgi:hypothetical protein
MYRRDKSPTSKGSEVVSYSSRQQNNQCRRNKAYSCVTHALGDHQTQLPHSSPTPNSFQHQASANQSPSGPHRSHGTPSNLPKSVTQNSASSTPPTITISGANPAIITIGDSYTDLGATVTDTGPGQAADTNLGYKTFLNGTLASNIVIDTSQVATDTIDYVATDSAGLTATSTRTVIILAASSTPPTSPPTDATTSAATSTSQ